MNGKKCNEMALKYLSGLSGEVRKGATKKYRKGAPGEMAEASAVEEMPEDELAELLASLEGEEEDEEKPNRYA